MTLPNPGRDDRIDALRGLALLGILLVNIQSFVWGGTSPAGYLLDDATALDGALFFLIVTFVNTKFMPLFAMLFGAGFALLLARLRNVTSAPHAVFRRRMLFLFAFGILHGVLFYFGDITQMYALAGLVLLLYDGHGLAALRRAVVLWWSGALALTVLLTWGWRAACRTRSNWPAELEANFAVFTGEGYLRAAADAGEPVRRHRAREPDRPADDRCAHADRHARAACGLAGGSRRAGVAHGTRDRARRRTAVRRSSTGCCCTRTAETYGLGAYSAVAAMPGALGATLSFAYAALFFRHASPALRALALRRPDACRSRTTCCSPSPWEPCCPAGASRWRPASVTRKPRRSRWRSSPRSSR